MADIAFHQTQFMNSLCIRKEAQEDTTCRKDFLIMAEIRVILHLSTLTSRGEEAESPPEIRVEGFS